MTDTIRNVKLFSNVTRLRILTLLSYHSMNVKQLSNILKIYQSKLSHQLTILRKNKVLKTKKRGRFINYSLETQEKISPIFKVIYKSLVRESLFQKDLNNARKLLKK
ncbi:MAG: metalloregulator ArsR/SmtB family transcription factor [bacterium]|nr:metalloregulator ArsR/SmtB family transcription factor [bacterium]